MLTKDGGVEIAVVSSTADGTVALRDPFELGGRNGGDAPGDRSTAEVEPSPEGRLVRMLAEVG